MEDGFCNLSPTTFSHLQSFQLMYCCLSANNRVLLQYLTKKAAVLICILAQIMKKNLTLERRGDENRVSAAIKSRGGSSIGNPGAVVQAAV